MLTWAAAGVAVVFGTWMVWQRRWISDDGFINYRIIQQLLAGRGPTYNAAERVEGGTSTLWLGLVWLGQAITPGSDTGAVMVALGTALSALALALLAVGAFALHPGRPLLLPVGLAVVVAIAPMWDFGTSGLETSLSMAWIAACFAGLAVRVRRGPAGRPAWQSWPLAVLIGLGPLVRPGGSFVGLTYLAAERVVPGYGGGMSTAKAALESDTRVLAFEAGRKWGHRVNVISAGPFASRAASAIGFIGRMIDFYAANSPLPEALTAAEVGNTAAFLCSPLASGITGETLHVDKGYNTMAVPADVQGILDALARE